jgi:hypothetical protein
VAPLPSTVTSSAPAATPPGGLSSKLGAPAGMSAKAAVGMPMATPVVRAGATAALAVAPMPSPYAAPSSSPYAAPIAAPAIAVTQAAPVVAPAPSPVLDEREHAIEVAAMLGDSVVGLKHCALPGQAPRFGAPAWLAVAVAAALIGAIAFGLTVRVAARNDERLGAWLAAKKPMHAFRPEVVGAGYDVAGFGGLGLALLAATMAVVRRRQGRLHPLFRIGTAPDVELPLAGASMASFPVVSARGGRLLVSYPRGASGELVEGGVSVPLDELVATGRARGLGDGSGELAMPSRARMKLRLGSATLLLSVVQRPARQLPVLAGQLEQRVLAYVGGALAVHLLIVGILRTIPEEETVATIELPGEDGTLVRTSGTANDVKPPELEKGKAADAAASGQQSSAAMALPAGAAGDAKATATNQRLAIKRTADEERLARMQAVDAARRSGFLGAEAMRSLNAVALTGTADLASGLDATFAAGNMYGEEVGAAHGGFGGAPAGVGPGGGGWDGIIGSGGKYTTIGTSPGDLLSSGSCGRPGPCGRVLGGDRSSVVPPVRIGEPTCSGETCIDRDIIRRYVKRAMEKIRYCYEKELLADASLEGTVLASFVISPTGTVMNAQAKGVQDNVASCVAGVVGAIKFPRGAGDAIQVNYPFTFRRPGA